MFLLFLFPQFFCFFFLQFFLVRTVQFSVQLVLYLTSRFFFFFYNFLSSDSQFIIRFLHTLSPLLSCFSIIYIPPVHSATVCSRLRISLSFFFFFFELICFTRPPYSHPYGRALERFHTFAKLIFFFLFSFANIFYFGKFRLWPIFVSFSPFTPRFVHPKTSPLFFIFLFFRRNFYWNNFFILFGFKHHIWSDHKFNRLAVSKILRLSYACHESLMSWWKFKLSVVNHLIIIIILLC